jgi:hypothetical protein
MDHPRRKLAQEQRSESAVVREALERYLVAQPSHVSACDLANRAGLIGCAKGLPKDLSTNPKYLTLRWFI